MKKDENIKKAMEEFEDIKPTEEQMDILEGLTDEYADKSEEDIFVEIIKMNEQIGDEMTPEEYEAIFEKLESLRPLLDEEQIEKLDKILDALGRG